MARFLKQSFAQTCLKETDNGKLQQFNYSRSLITNRGNGQDKLTDMLIDWQIQWTWSAMFKRLPDIGIQFKVY